MGHNHSFFIADKQDFRTGLITLRGGIVGQEDLIKVNRPLSYSRYRLLKDNRC